MGIEVIVEKMKKASEVNDKTLEINRNFDLKELKENKQLEAPAIEPDVSLIKGKSLESIVEYNKQNEISEVKEKNKPIENKIEGSRREDEVNKELEKQYPSEDGYTIESEVYLRDENGQIVKDPVTGEARRIDFVVIKDGKVIDSIEVTSKTADKTEQSAKEARIRENGGNYIKDSNGDLVEIPEDVTTKIERRD
ncbi:hypothetical protein [Bacillus sp. CGMCC 1.16541]|uniref:hypothetical protein n=1 Tax=Bacillus sp. CGMCC 1.16541 TaxID=2185143 RepID=UPI00194FEDF0|nr:hypothetical protein [Bacillus sp. CGMCC 1.16541]